MDSSSRSHRNVWLDRRSFIGGSDARIIMGDDEAALRPALAGKAGRDRAGGSIRRPGRPARHCDRAR